VSATAKTSAILIARNNERTAHRAVDSILYQIDSPCEILIADCGCSDNTIEIVRERLKEAGWDRYTVLGAGEGNDYTAFHFAIARAKGEYIAFLDANDWWSRSDKLRIQISFLDRHRECSAAFTNFFFFDPDRLAFSARDAISDKYSYVNTRDIILNNISCGFSVSMYRSASLFGIPTLGSNMPPDCWMFDIFASRKAPLAFLHSACVVHQLGGGASRATGQQAIEFNDELTGWRFHEEFSRLASVLGVEIKPSPNSFGSRAFR